jgi:hypothetical protein
MAPGRPIFPSFSSLFLFLFDGTKDKLNTVSYIHLICQKKKKKDRQVLPIVQQRWRPRFRVSLALERKRWLASFPDVPVPIPGVLVFVLADQPFVEDVSSVARTGHTHCGRITHSLTHTPLHLHLLLHTVFSRLTSSCPPGTHVSDTGKKIP